MEISRYLMKEGDSRIIPKELWISLEEWSIYASKHPNLRSSGHGNGEQEPDFFVFSNKNEQVELRWLAGRIKISYSRFSAFTESTISDISKDLNAHFMINENDLYPIESIIQAKRKLQKNIELKEYQEERFDVNLRWLAIKARSVKKVLNYFGLDNLEKVSWSQSVEKVENNLIITPKLNGWIFIIGHNLPIILSDVTDCDEVEDGWDYLVCELKEVSKSLGEVQYYEYADVGMESSAFFLAKGGEMIYGLWSCEEESYEIGKIPSKLKKVSLDAHSVASVYSIDIDDLVFLPEVEDIELFLYSQKEWECD